MNNLRKIAAASMAYSLLLSGCATTSPNNFTSVTTPVVTVTPTTSAKVIKHVVVIFGENVSFDHYFGTYPNAANIPGEPAFTAAAGTLTPNNYTSNPNLLTQNPNLATNGAVNTANGTGATNPFRLDRAQASTGSQSHSYTPEQMAFDNGKMDLFPANPSATADGPKVRRRQKRLPPFASTKPASPWATSTATPSPPTGTTRSTTRMSDRHFDVHLRALNPRRHQPHLRPDQRLCAVHQRGERHHAAAQHSMRLSDGQGGNHAHVGDAEPLSRRHAPTPLRITWLRSSGKNIGDLLNAERHHLGLVPGWLQPVPHQPQRNHRLLPLHSLGRRRHPGRLCSAPRAIPVLRHDPQPLPRPAHFGSHDRHYRRRQPPVRHQ